MIINFIVNKTADSGNVKTINITCDLKGSGVWKIS